MCRFDIDDVALQLSHAVFCRSFPAFLSTTHVVDIRNIERFGFPNLPAWEMDGLLILLCVVGVVVAHAGATDGHFCMFLRMIGFLLLIMLSLGAGSDPVCSR